MKMREQVNTKKIQDVKMRMESKTIQTIKGMQGYSKDADREIFNVHNETI